MTNSAAASAFGQWLQSISPKYQLDLTTVSRAGADAGFRSYHRIAAADGRSFIAMNAEGETPESFASFIKVDGLLRNEAGLNAPEIFEADTDHRFMLLSDLGVVQGQEASDYNKYLTDLNQYNTDRDFDYGAWLDRYNMLGNNLQAGLNMDAQELERYLAQLQQYNTDRDFYYGQLLDEINDQTNDFGTLVDMAQLAAGYGDYRGLEDLGIQLPAPSGYYSTSQTGNTFDPNNMSAAAQDILASYNNALKNISPGAAVGLPRQYGVMIKNALLEGLITEDEADYLISSMGYGN